MKVALSSGEVARVFDAALFNALRHVISVWETVPCPLLLLVND